MGYACNNTKLKSQYERLDPSFNDLEDSFLDSLLNFDGWVEDRPNSSLAQVMNSEETPNLEQMSCLEIKEHKEVDTGSSIQEQIGRVCLTSDAEEIAEVKQETTNVEVVSEEVKSCVNDNEVRYVEDDDDSEDSEDDEQSSSSSSSSDDDDEEEEDDDEGLKKVKGEVEMEEGEIRDEVIAWSDDDEDVVKGPIRSVNEVQDLPPVPPVTVTTQPHHQTLPVGSVLSIMGTQVIVEGVEDHNPLSEGSILWITETRHPLGVVDEIFGPVKNPYYMVRYNSETEIPTGIQQGSLISFVPEFADHVLNNNNLYKKGYDASGENDEECSEEVEFSDDEKEAEYKRMMKMTKRGSNGERNTRVKKDKKSRNRGGNWKYDHQPSASGLNNGPTSGPNSCPSSGLNNGPASGLNNGPTSGLNSGPNSWPVSGPTSGLQAFSQAPNMTPSGVWPYGLPSFQLQNVGFSPNGFPSNVPPFMQQNFMQQPFQNLGLPNLAPQFNTAPGQMFPHNFVQGAYASWPTGMPQNNFNQSQAGPPMVFPGVQQGVAMPNRSQPQVENSNGSVRPFVATANGDTPQNGNQGNGFSNRGGRKPFQRGGGRFRGGRNGPRSG